MSAAPVPPAIRRATEADLPALEALAEAFEAHLNAIDPANPTTVPPERRAAVLRFALGPWPCRAVLLAGAGDAPLGFLAFQEIVWMDDGAPALWVSDLYVAPDARGRGAGAALMAAAQAEARARGGARVVFTVWRENAPARAFYARLGAREVGDELLMSLGV
ncbi:MAG: GNAT family N-acetyltransferase [Rubrimonas sp.]|uniref:GNAT family N-acetyltransferase n=1 Tax=Rubrimonas sp. TaxID=2036015 RepID=UPI002FDD2417